MKRLVVILAAMVLFCLPMFAFAAESKCSDDYPAFSMCSHWWTQDPASTYVCPMNPKNIMDVSSIMTKMKDEVSIVYDGDRDYYDDIKYWVKSFHELGFHRGHQQIAESIYYYVVREDPVFISAVKLLAKEIDKVEPGTVQLAGDIILEETKDIDFNAQLMTASYKYSDGKLTEVFSKPYKPLRDKDGRLTRDWSQCALAIHPCSMECSIDGRGDYYFMKCPTQIFADPKIEERMAHTGNDYSGSAGWTIWKRAAYRAGPKAIGNVRKIVFEIYKEQGIKVASSGEKPKP